MSSDFWKADKGRGLRCKQCGISPVGGSRRAAELTSCQLGDWGRREAHTMHCKADKGCVSLIFTINFQFTGNLWKGSSGAALFLSSYICTLDLVRIAHRWPETSANGPTNPKHWITQRRLYEGAAQPNGGLADTLVYGNRHRGFDIWASIFFFIMEVGRSKSRL